MKKILIVFIVLLSSCKGTQENILFDQKLEMCQKARVDNRINIFGAPKDSIFHYMNFLSGFENGLVLHGFLNKIDRKSYKNLFLELKQEKIKKSIIKKLETGKGLEKDIVHCIVEDLGCLVLLVDINKLVDKNDFRYKMLRLGEEIGNKQEYNSLIDMLIDQIPEREFKKIEYRRIVIRLVYFKLHFE
ncbi:hypothetical protein EGM88_15780 [Aureibaculum marinum]|uniref:Lipoprotein n=1 Tax=Aureibaculum marinum TaxID=2487930 RepID=A0A3N4N6C9_9FLAO|nr:hypothetical protein [Aureibaculum marinum]RPD89707.1 hypothetical protein EGM88_15780 [Aureibaculum marinum]